MDESLIYQQVSSWVRTHRNPDSIEQLRKFVDNSLLSGFYKEKLYREIDYKESILRRQPLFKKLGDKFYLAEEDGTAKTYTGRFTACCKLAELTLRGFDVSLETAADGKTWNILLDEPGYNAEKMIISKTSRNHG